MLTQLQLRDFKSFRDVSVDLGPLVVLVGANAAGKGNLFDALRILHGVGLEMPVSEILRGRWEGGREIWPGIRGGVADAARAGGSRISIASTWNGPDLDFRHDLEISTNGAALVERERLGPAAGASYLFDTHAPSLGADTGRDEGQSIRAALARTGSGRNLPANFSAARSILGQLSPREGLAPGVLDGAEHLLKAMRREVFLDITPSRMRGYSPRAVEELGVEGQNISSTLRSLCEDDSFREELVDWLAELCGPELENVEFVETEIGDVMFALREASGSLTPARSLSDGTLRFLGQLVALRTAWTGSLLLIEEIDSGLHPRRTHLLVEALESATATGHLQVIATTHSPLVLSSLSPEAQRDAVLVARDPETGWSVLRRLGDLPHFEEVSSKAGVDHLMTAGWLERALANGAETVAPPRVAPEAEPRRLGLFAGQIEVRADFDDLSDGWDPA